MTILQSRPVRASVALAAASLALLVSSPALGQYGASQVIKPWEDGPHIAETYDEPMFIEGGEVMDGEGEIGVFYWDSVGRIRFDKEETDPEFSLGYRFLTIEIDSDGHGLPGGMSNIALSGAWRMSDADSNWVTHLVGGAGIATDNHFGNTEAIYGIGAIDFMKRVSETSAWHLGVDYNGSRALWPDLPLPYVTYRAQVSDSLSFRLGLPETAMLWTPGANVRVEASYTFPQTLFAYGSWMFTENVGLFAEAGRSIDGVVRDERQGSDRLFYEFNRVAGGVRVVWGPWIDASIGVGWAFDQKWSNGFDMHDLDTMAEVSDEMLFMVGLRGRF